MEKLNLPDEEVKRMRAAGIPVPETIEDVEKLLAEAEQENKKLDLDEAFRDIRARLMALKASKSA